MHNFLHLKNTPKNMVEDFETVISYSIISISLIMGINLLGWHSAFEYEIASFVPSLRIIHCLYGRLKQQLSKAQSVSKEIDISERDLLENCGISMRKLELYLLGNEYNLSFKERYHLEEYLDKMIASKHLAIIPSKK